MGTSTSQFHALHQKLHAELRHWSTENMGFARPYLILKTYRLPAGPDVAMCDREYSLLNNDTIETTQIKKLKPEEIQGPCHR
jgi:hypothetical protein